MSWYFQLFDLQQYMGEMVMQYVGIFAIRLH